MLRDEARLKSAQRRHPHEYEGVERHHPTPQLVGHEGLQHGVGERGGDDHRAAGQRLERERHADGAHGGEQHQEQPERRSARQQDHTLTDPRPLDGESQGPEHGPDTHCRHQQAVAARVGVQDVASDHRHQHDEREPQHAEYCHQGHQRPHPGIAPDERHGLTDALPGRGWHRARHERREPHGEEAGDHGDVAHAVQEEAHADAGDPNQHSRNRRADDPGGVEHGRVERDRVHEILFADELHDERLAGGNVERVDDAEEHRQRHDLPRRDPAGPHEHGQRQRFEHLQGLRPHDELALVHPIHDDTRVQREQQDAHGAERLRQADGERRVGDVEHEPPECDRLHPGPDDRDALTEEEQPEVAVGKRSEPKRARGGGGAFVHCGKARRRPIFRVGSPMKYTTYSRYLPELADTVNLQALLDQLADFLLQSGFAGGAYSHPFWGEFGEEESDRSLDALRQAILQALMDSGQLTPEMLKLLRGESTGDAARDADLERQLSELLDKIVQKLIDEGYLNVAEAPKMPSGQQPLFGPGGMAKEAAQQVQFNLTEKGIDFLGYRTLKHLLGSIGKSSFGAHDTEHLATGIEAEAVSKPYEYGDTLNLDVNATLTNALQREGLGVPINLEYDDLMVHQAEYRSASVLMLDCSHSMILYGEDRFTPAKKVALALTHLIRTQFPGDTLRVVLFHDTAEEIPLGQLAHAQVGPYHTNTAEGLKLARRILMGQRKDMRQIIMITDGKPSALTQPDGRIYVNSMGLDPHILQATYGEVALCRRSGILINTFMLARDRSLVEFVKKVSAICRGKAYFTNTMTLGQFILMDFMRRKTRRVS